MTFVLKLESKIMIPVPLSSTKFFKLSHWLCFLDNGVKIMIKEDNENVITNKSTECRTANCASKTEEDEIQFESQVLSADHREPGLKCQVVIFTRTGPSESDHTIVTHFEGQVFA